MPPVPNDRVEVAVGGVAGEREVEVQPGAERVAGDEDVAVAGQRDAVGEVVGAEVGDRACRGRRRTSSTSPVVGVAHERDVPVGGAGDDDAAVGPDGHGTGDVRRRAEVGEHEAVAVEALVERAVAVVAGEREVAVGE